MIDPIYFIIIPIVLFSLTVHEYSHALASYKLGDDTAKRLGRLTLNPLNNISELLIKQVRRSFLHCSNRGK